MRLLRVIASLDPRGGGPVESARTTDFELLRNGNHVEVVCLDAPEDGHDAMYPVPVHSLGPSFLHYRYNNRLVPWLRKNRHRFDAVIVDGLWQYHSFAAWRALAGTDTPYFVFTHGMLDPWFKKQHPLKHLKKWLYWPWGDYRVLRDARTVLFTSEEERHASRTSFWMYRCIEAVVPLGTAGPTGDAAGLRDVFLSEYPSLRDKHIVLFLGRIHPIKGCDLLLEAFSTVASHNQSMHLVLAGPDHGSKAQLQHAVERLGIRDRVTWTGMLQGDKKWEAFCAADVFCLPSHHENFGIVVSEALACATPVLISNKVNIWREIEDCGAGFVQDDTLEGTIKGLERWLAITSDEEQAMRECALDCFNARFRIDRAAAALMDIFESGLRSAGGEEVVH